MNPAAGDVFGEVDVQSSPDGAKEKKPGISGTQILFNRIVTGATNNGVKRIVDAYAGNMVKPSSRERQTALVGGKHGHIPSESGPISPTSDTDALYDVHPSDEEYRGKFGSHGLTVGKRRKITSPMESEEILYIHDDETLQRHVAAEAYTNPRERDFQSGRRFVDGRPPLSRDLTKNPHGELTDPTPGESQAFSTALSISKPTQVLSKDNTSKTKTFAKLRVSDLQPRKRRKPNVDGIAKSLTARTTVTSYRPQRSNGNTQVRVKRHNESVQEAMEITRPSSMHSNNESHYSSNSIPQPQTPPHTPTRSRKLIGGITTPRQRGSLDVLLKQDRKISSPSNLDLPNLKLRDVKAEKPLNHRTDSVREKGASEPVPAMRRSRRRLVDNLQRIDGKEFDSSDGSDNDIISDNDDVFSSSHSHAPPEQGVLSNDASQITPEKRSALQARVSAFSQVTQPLSQGGIPKVTYARQRSYITDDGLGEVAMFGESITHATTTEASNARRRVTATVAELEPKKTHDEIDDFGYSQVGTMRSIHELRKAGGTVRLVSEIETMLDDIDEKSSVSVTLKRTTLQELVVKLQEASFCRLFVGQGLELRLLANVGLSNDVIINTLYAVAIWYLLIAPTSIQILPQVSAENVVNHLIRLLDNDQDLAQLLRDRKMNMSKLIQDNFRDLFGSLLRSANWRAGNPQTLTPRVLCLQCLEYLVRQTREAGSEAEVLPPRAMRRIVRLLKPKAPSLKQQPIIPLTTDLRLAVSVLESCTLSNGSSVSDLLWTGETLDTVMDLLPLLVPTTDQQSGSMQTLVLRLYLNLTNNSPELCKAFSRPNLIGAVFEIVGSHFRYLSDNITNMEQSLILDNLILSLGSLLNLAEWCDDLALMVLDNWYGDVTFLDSLLEIFMAKLEKTGEVRFVSASID